ncbi:DNA starvation/stationary phase protection protein [Microbacterium sp. zg.Y1090]|uniref:Dps family protein n=1 Tax=Microbacterium TaxID=33882 RepID=UPI00214B8056|nr:MULTISPECIES: DNA starvation/stationary phase protection protein [unclassified Microbacterium]MCR2812656.1 DNA starvation/stationary phase protection protein [Microbacterium sp. zg.Y1084]MCR2817549.1 DNA starvation/stationary phase protection protein [Microbacterium sp. zg.Y1090]MDL5485809.1 DNA starvation/stationary phase protection protein [Microbacterium sp. zg-Y1211]WIM28971.1 DNA starvation/stationary phase protection protein [Microbacterium sp. zg-Y1090]
MAKSATQKSTSTKDAAASTAKTNRRRSARGGEGAKLTKEENAEKGFTASAALSENLQRVLVDLIELSLQGKQAHWNVVGTNFRDTHLQLDEIIEAARGFSDDVAERMRALHALPDGRSDLVAATTTLPEFPQGEIATTEVIDLMTERLDGVCGTCRDVHDDVDEEDPTSADLLHAVLERLEQLSWMVSAENRTPKR